MAQDKGNIRSIRTAVGGADNAPGPSDRKIAGVFEQNEARLIMYLTHRLNSLTDAQDAAQAVFVRLWNRRHDLHDGNLVAMLFVTARNHATDMLRSRQRDRSVFVDRDGDELSSGAEADAPSAERVVAARQDLDLILRLLEELPAKCRKCFILYKFEDRNFSEIAGELGISESMVRKYVLRAIAHCADRYAQLEGWT